MEADVLRTRRMLEHGKDGGHGAAEVVGIEGHGHVDGGGGADGIGRWDWRAVWGIVELRSFSKL